MDDLDHSVYIAEQDWDCFFQESEECDLQQGALAGLDDSGLSDFDEAEFCLSNQQVRPTLESGPLGSRSSIDSTSDFEVPPIEPHESTKVLQDPKDSVSAGRDEETVNVFFESTADSEGDEDLEELSHAGQTTADLSKDSSLDKPQEATEPAGACCSALGRDVYQETARDCEDAIVSTCREPEFQTNDATTINLSAEPVPQGDIVLHASNCPDVTFALSSLQACNEHGYYRSHSEWEAYSVLKGSQEGMSLEMKESGTEQSSLMRPSTSFFNPQKDTMNTEAQIDANIPASAEALSDCEKPPRKEKERWFVTVNVTQTHSREKTWPPAKKKRRKKSCSEDGPELDTKSEGRDSGIQSNLGAERLGVSEPENQEMDANPDNYLPHSISAAERPSSCESAEPTTSTITGHHKLKNDHGVLSLSNEPWHVFQTICEQDKHKLNYRQSQYVDNHQEQQTVSMGNNLQMNVTQEGQLALKQQNDGKPETSQPICSQVSGWTEPSKPATVMTPNPPNHQNLLAKLLFSSQSDPICEMLVFCKDSYQETLHFSQEERPSQKDTEDENQWKPCVQYSQTDAKAQKYPEHSICSSEISVYIESPEFSNGSVFETIPGSRSLHKCLSADQLVDFESKKFLSEVPQITEVPKPGVLSGSESNTGLVEFDQSKDFVTSAIVENCSKIRKDHACPDQQEVEKSNGELSHSEETSMACPHGAERGDAPAVISERDSSLSASDNTQPPIVNSCVLTADQQDVAKKPHLEPATLHPIDATISFECSVDLSPNESSIMMLRDSTSHKCKSNEVILRGDGLSLRSENMSQTDNVEYLTTRSFPESLDVPLGPIKGETKELDSEETLATDMPTAGLSAVESPENTSKSVEDEPILPKEPVVHMGGLEDREPDPALDSSRPVYAISSFWDEMEKLTINDILHLRLVGNAQYPREFPHLQDSATADVSDAADSGYFAHPDDSKPDRWIGDAPLFSDFDDEFRQTLSASANPSPEPQDASSQVLRSPDPSGLWWECKPDPACVGKAIPSEDSISQHLFSDSTQEFKTVCQTLTVQNLQTLVDGAQSSVPLPMTLRREDDSISLQERPVKTCSLSLSEPGKGGNSSPLYFGKASPEKYVMSFPEISKNLLDEDKEKASLSGRASPNFVSLPETHLSGRTSPIVVSLPEIGLSDRTAPLGYALSETNLSDRASPIVYSLSETGLSGMVSPIVVSLSETNLSDRANPIVYSLSETNLLDRASPLVYSLSETNLSDRASPLVYSLPETNLSDRASPLVYSLPETNLSDRASPLVYSLSETNLSDRASPLVYSLSETNLLDRASPIDVSLPETSLSGKASPIASSMSETNSSDSDIYAVCSLSETSLSGTSSPIVPLYERTPGGLSLPETYDYFFSDYDTTDLFFPPIWTPGNHTGSGVPIFSCSRSVKREYRFVEEYDFIFPEGSPVESVDEDRHTPIHVVSNFEDQANDPLDALVGVDAHENFITNKDKRGNLFWRNLMSLRRLRFTGGLYTSHGWSNTWACAVTGWRERSAVLRPTDPGDSMGVGGISYPHPNFYLENQLCTELRERRDTDMQTIVTFPKKAFLFTLKQSDICLVCIAFASWVLKSTNPQSADTWKTALLANVSAISAIQYLRRYMREDASENKR